MPLSPPTADRQLSHTRNITAKGYLRADGMWDIEAEIRDIKTFDIPNQDRGGVIKAGDCLHNMWVRLTIDEDLLIHQAEAVTDGAPFYLCGDIVDVYKKLEGVKIAPGWTRQVKQLFGGIHGCTHITELLSVVSTVAFQTLYSDRMRLRRQDGGVSQIDKSQAKRQLNGCHALAVGSPIAKREFGDVGE